MDTQTPQGYAALRNQELNGIGVASNQEPSWPAKQAAARAQEQLSSQQAAARDRAHKARINWTPLTSGSRKRGR